MTRRRPYSENYVQAKTHLAASVRCQDSAHKAVAAENGKDYDHVIGLEGATNQRVNSAQQEHELLAASRLARS